MIGWLAVILRILLPTWLSDRGAGRAMKGAVGKKLIANK
jgi:hypothetical protein